MNNKMIEHNDKHDIENERTIEFRSGICENLFFQILSRTSIQTFDLLRCTSNYVNRLTYNDHLLSLYNKRNNVVYGNIVQHKKPDGKYSLKFVPSHGSKSRDLTLLKVAHILASSEQGLLMCVIPESDYPKPIFFICKPCTEDTKPLPFPHESYISVKFAIVVIGINPLHYKIIRISQNKSRENEDEFEAFQIEVFDSLIWRWTEFDSILLPLSVYPVAAQPIVCRGFVFLLLSDGNILSIDTYSHKYSHILLPSPTIDYIPYTSKLVKMFGKLGFLYKRSHTSWDIWLLTVDNRWDRYNADFADGYAKEWWDVRDHKLYFYIGNKVHQEVSLYRSYDVFSFRSDFENIKFTGPFGL